MNRLALLSLLLTACGPGHQANDAKAPEGPTGTEAGGAPPAPKSGGMLQIKGSDTMVNLAQAWAEEYRKVKPDATVSVSGGGSGTGIAALENGTVDIADASREIKPEEHDLIVKNSGGKEPTEYTVAYDALAIYVNPANPITKITKAQLADIYGENGKATKWTDLGVTVPGCQNQEIIRVSRQSNSGTYDYFREWTLGKDGDFKLGSRDMQGSKDVVDLVTHTPCAIGYSGMGYKTPEVKWACVAKDDASACAEPSVAAVLDKSYPISRGLYVYTLGEATGDVGRYIQWIMSDPGQAIVEKSGFVPLPADKRKPAPAG
jgi:phosphate transport system substrate-binding protein